MTPSEIFADVFLNFSLAEMEKEVNLLLEIALITDNGNYDYPEERDRLFFFKQNLLRCLEAGKSLADIQYKRNSRKISQAHLTM